MDNKLLPAGDFAKLSRTSKAALHHYDSIGVLPPAARWTNGYRYYSTAQLSIVNVIHILQDLGMSLEQIKDVKDQRSPEFLDELYVSQMEKVDEKIDNWARARRLLQTMREIVQSVTGIDEGAISIQSLPAVPILRGDLCDYSNQKNAYNALTDFYQTMGSRHPNLDPNYPVWAIFAKETILRRDYADWMRPDYYYFYNPDGFDRRPAAEYAIGYTRGEYGQTGELYRRILDYIDASGHEVCGDAYEEYPLNELSISDPTRYLIRILITVQKKK